MSEARENARQLLDGVAFQRAEALAQVYATLAVADEIAALRETLSGRTAAERMRDRLLSIFSPYNTSGQAHIAMVAHRVRDAYEDAVSAPVESEEA